MKLNRRFRATLRKHRGKGAWTFIQWSESVEFFRTRGLVKVRGTVDGQPFRASFMAMGNGRHMLPVKAELREAIGKKPGDTVTVHLRERIV